MEMKKSYMNKFSIWLQNKMKNRFLTFLLLIFCCNLIAQSNGQITGDFSLNLQSYVEDAAINAAAALKARTLFHTVNSLRSPVF